MEQQGPDAARNRAEQLHRDALYCLSQKRFNEAMILIQKALILQPVRSSFHSLQGEIYWALGKTDLARTKFNRALQLDPDDAIAHRYLAGPPSQVSNGSADLSTRSAPTTPLATLPVREQPGWQDLTLTSQDEEVALEGARQVMTRLVQTEMLLKTAGALGGQVFQKLTELRQELGRRIQSAFKARSEEQPPTSQKPAAVATQPLVSSPAEASPWQDTPPFQKVLGPPGGGVGVISQGPEVLNLQKVLRQKGFTLPLSGGYDRYTAAAVRQFQEKHGIKPANGIVGAETRRVLNAIIGKDLPA